MRKGIIPTVSIDSDQIRKEIKAAGYSIRSLAPEIGVDRRTIMNALKAGEMQLYLLKLIDDKIHIREKTVWMRLGVSVPVTEDELFDMMEQTYMKAQELFENEEKVIKGLKCAQALPEDALAKLKEMVRIDYIDYILTESEAAYFLKRAVVDGDSYIPGCCFRDHIDWWLKERERRGLK